MNQKGMYMSGSGYRTGVEFEKMNSYKFHTPKAKRIGAVGRVIGYGSLFAGVIGAFVAWLIDYTALTLASLALAAVGMSANYFIHQIALKNDKTK